MHKYARHIATDEEINPKGGHIPKIPIYHFSAMCGKYQRYGGEYSIRPVCGQNSKPLSEEPQLKSIKSAEQATVCRMKKREQRGKGELRQVQFLPSLQTFKHHENTAYFIHILWIPVPELSRMGRNRMFPNHVLIPFLFNQ